MAARGMSGYRIDLLSNLPPASRPSRAVLVVAAVLLLGFGILAPFAGRPLPQIDGFIPALDATIFLTDFITSALLFALFSISLSRALLALACGYLFASLIVVAHAFSFPGAFSSIGNLGGGGETTLRLYLIWHLGFPVALLAYAWLKDEKPQRASKMSAKSAICWSVAVVTGLACALVWLAVAGDRLLPSVRGASGQIVLVAPWAISVTMVICAIALVAVWVRRRSALDQWLMIVAFAMMVELALTAVFGGPRFSLGFYTGRIFSVVTSTAVLVMLLAGTTRLYARLAHAHAMLELERDNKLMNIEAVTASISHEVSQPLTAIASNSGAARNFLEMKPPRHDEALSALGDVIIESHRAREVLDGIRSLFRKADLEPKRIDMNEIASGVLQALRGELREHGVATTPEFARGLPLIQGNRGQLQEVILNLVRNAVEAMNMTTDRARVLRVVTQPLGRDAIAVAVQDSGPGIDPERLEDIFDAFVTTKLQGMGLGLAICRNIAERHGGQLTASSDGRNGALFQLILPIEPTDPKVASAP